MRRVFLLPLIVFGVFLASEAMANRNIESCAGHRDRCKLSWPADKCDKIFEYAKAHGGVWESRYFDRRMNQRVTTPVACSL